MPAAARGTGRTEKRGAPEPIAALNRVRILEYTHPWSEREPLVDVRTYCPEVSWHEHVCPYLRRTVADRVNRAQSSLAPGYRLRAGTALRTLSMQSGGWDSFYRRMREEHPNWPLSALRRATNKYFAPYDQKAPPGHCTGGAIDVGLLDPEGNSLDMIAPTQGWEAAYTWSEKISPEAKANRMRMVEAMLGAGFSNCRDEYWHYSYGDSAWAVRVGETECLYGWAHPPVALEANFAGASVGELHIETARDVNGRALHAEGNCTLPPEPERTPEGIPLWRVGLYWAKGVPVSLRLHWPFIMPAVPSLYVGDGKEAWEPMPEVCREGDILLIHVTPTADRRILSTVLPPRTGD
ncbi:MAG TPA: M15 family metallopeptidase [Chthonomonadaceae bacterium]|nr:M15 family metallopeptidase [Chthonomonadaceae bacterium]